MSGGAIANSASAINVTGSAFINNAAVDGGAMYITGNAASNSVKNSTFNKNTVTVNTVSAGGGAIEVNQGVVDLVSDTLAGNIITAQGSPSFAHGAGLYNLGGTISALGSILASNSVNFVSNGPQIYSSNCSGAISDKGFNIESGTECALTRSSDGSAPDQQNVTPDQLKLGPIADNTGPTETMALGNGSVAINRGANDTTCPATDQRGIQRRPICDIGAFEFRAPVFNPSLDMTVDIASANSGVSGSVTSTKVSWPATIASEPDASDAPTVNCIPVSGGVFYVGTTTVTCIAKDAASPANETTGTFTVTVKNSNNVPTLTVPDTINVQATSADGASVTYSVTAEDTSYPASQLALSCVKHATTTSYPVGVDVSSPFPMGLTQVDCSLTNPTGKTISKSFTVQVTDYPTVNVPASVTLPATSAQGSTVDFTVTASDPGYAAIQLTITCTPDAGSLFPIGTTQVTCTANNPANNPHSENFNVVVQDIPAITTPDWTDKILVVDATDKDGATVDLSQYVTARNQFLPQAPTISCWLHSDENKINIYPQPAAPSSVRFRAHDASPLPVFPVTTEGNGTQVDCQSTNKPDKGPGFTSTVVSFFVKVHDVLLPVLNVSDSITVNATTAQGAVVNYSVIASDPVYPSDTLTVSC